jgi:hypothetical protein
LGIGVVAGKSALHFVERQFGQKSHAVERLLPVSGNVVTQAFEAFPREILVHAFGFLQANDVRLPAGEPSHEVVQSLFYGIDVPGGDPHGGLRNPKRRSV